MKTLKFNGKEYQVVDLWFVDGRVKSLKIIAVINNDGLMDFVEFRADFNTNLDYVITEFKQQYMTKRTAKILFEC